MYFFLILSLPAIVFFYCLYHSEYKLIDFLIPVLIGITIGIIVTIFKEYFVFSMQITRANFFYNALSMTKQIFFPTAFFCILWEFLSKDEDRFKDITLFPLIASFYIIYNPYLVISVSDKTSFFMLFLSPILIMSMIFWVQSLVSILKKTISYEKKKEIKVIVIIASSLIIAIFAYPLIHSLWYLKICAPLYIFLSIMFIISSIISHKIVFRKNNY